MQDEKLKSLIIEWTQQKNRALSNYENISSKTEVLVTYLLKNYPLKNIDAYGILAWKEPSTIKTISPLLTRSPSLFIALKVSVWS